MTTATKERTKVVMNAGTFKAALSSVMEAVPTRSPRPILTNVRLGDGLLTATDLELRIDREIDYHGDAILLPAARLKQILDTVPSEADVTLEPGTTSCRVKAVRGSWTLPTEDPDEYPSASTGSLDSVCRMPIDQFSRAIVATAYATDEQSSRYALSAILLEVDGGNPTFVATDGRRLAIVKAETDQAVDDRNDSANKPSLMIPVRAAKAATAGDGDSVQIETDGKSVVFTSGGLTVTGVMVSGSFPRWRDVIPDRDANASAVNRGNLMSATNAAKIVTSEQSKGVTYTFGKNLRLEAQSVEAGHATVTCEVEDQGDAGRVNLDPRFVFEFLKNLNAEADPIVEVEIAGPGDAVVLRCDDVTGVIMPLAEG